MPRPLPHLFPLLLFLSIFIAFSKNPWRFFEHRYEYKLSDVIEADRFVKKDRYWEAYRGNQLVGYVLLSKDWTPKLVGYSGKHMETLIGIDKEGNITGVKLIYHSEPIVLIGLSERQYHEFLKQYKGKNIKGELRVGREISMDVITGATVTAVVQNSIIVNSARMLAESLGILKARAAARRRIKKTYERLSWGELLKIGAVKRVRITGRDLGLRSGELYLDLYFAVIDPPSVGRNLLKEEVYKRAMERGANFVLLIFSTGGKVSFKGKGFARGGIFDGFNIEQAGVTHIFRETDYKILTRKELKVREITSFKEGGLFFVNSSQIDPTREFLLNLIVPFRVDGEKKVKNFSVPYRVPGRFLE
jgi:NosR/NirI family nitrous oxide reductase transcriptional regulator